MTERTITPGAIVRLVRPLASPLMFVDTFRNPDVTLRIPPGGSGVIEPGVTWAVCRWWTERHGMQTDAIQLSALTLVATAEEVRQAQLSPAEHAAAIRQAADSLLAFKPWYKKEQG